MAEAAEHPSGPMAPRPFHVVRRRRETADTWTLELEPADGPQLDPAPGQFTMLYSLGVGEVPISVSRIEGRRLVHTIRDVGAVTAALCASKPGSALGVRGPFGNVWPVERAEGGDVVVVAGGIGMAPLRPVVHQVLRERARFGRALLLYGGRRPQELLYPRELDELRARDDLDVRLTVDTADSGWRGRVGVVPKLVDDAHFDPANATAFVCGPEIMMRFTAEALIARGMPADRIHASMERNMTCGLGYCGHCQLGPTLICRDGPVYRWDELAGLLAVREL